VTSPPRRATQHASRARVQPCLAVTQRGTQGNVTRTDLRGTWSASPSRKGWPPSPPRRRNRRSSRL